jgi:hypothetical protein
VFVAVGLQDFVAGRLDDLGGWDVDGVTLEGPVDNVASSPAAVVLFRVALGSGREVLDGGVALDAVLLGQGLVNGGIDGAELDLALQLASGLVPVRLQAL